MRSPFADGGSLQALLWGPCGLLLEDSTMVALSMDISFLVVTPAQEIESQCFRDLI